MSQWALDWVVLSVTWVLSAIVVASYAVLLAGLFIPGDDKEIFSILGPSLSATTGAFIGILGALKMVEKTASGANSSGTATPLPATQEGKGGAG